jgi:hypothetical protein
MILSTFYIIYLYNIYDVVVVFVYLFEVWITMDAKI